MKYSVLVLGLALACGVTVANAKVAKVQAVSCALEAPVADCTFEGNGSEVYFAVNYQTQGEKQKFTCSLAPVSKDETVTTAKAKVWPGKDAHFQVTNIDTSNDLDPLVVTFAGTDEDKVGQIKFRLMADRSYEKHSIGVSCSPVSA